jgi:hypothetical protein
MGAPTGSLSAFMGRWPGAGSRCQGQQTAPRYRVLAHKLATVGLHGAVAPIQSLDHLAARHALQAYDNVHASYFVTTEY